MKKLLFIYNTHAGKGLLKSRLAAVLEELARDWDVTVHPTRGAGDAAELAARRAGEFDRLVCGGGDGTLHEVVNGLMALPPEARPEVGYIPAGTTNDFSRNLSLPRGMEAMARTAAAGVPRPVDIGRFNGEHFIYVAAFGAFTDVSYNTPQPVKNLLGRTAYMLESVTRIASIQSYPLTVEHDGGVEAVLALPAKYRTAVHLYYYEELSVAEIAKITGKSESAVKSRLFRARAMLREALKEDDDVSERL